MKNMDLITGGLIVGGIALGFKVLGGSKGGAKATTTTTPVVPCVDTSKDCAALIACAGPILAKATPADVGVLTAMSTKAALLGCVDLVSQISILVAKLGKPGEGGGTEKAGSYTVISGLGVVTAGGAKPGDMLILGLLDSTNSKKYITPVAYSKVAGPNQAMTTFERILADIATAKFMASDAGKAVAPLLGSGAILPGAPPDLADGLTLLVSFAGFPITKLGDVLGVVTSEQMKSGLSATDLASPSYTSSSSAVAGEQSVAGEEDFLAPNHAFGSTFGSHGRNLGSNFGGGSRFGGSTRIGG